MGTFTLKAFSRIEQMNEGSGSSPALDKAIDSCGVELATRLAENAHDTNQASRTYEVLVHGAQWAVEVSKLDAVIKHTGTPA